MKTIHLSYPHILSKEELPETVAAIGFFDGIHRGHQAVIQTAIDEAKRRNMESAIITFHPHPSVVLKNDSQKVKYITPLKKKQEILQQLNIDRVYIITFNKELASLQPDAFIEHFIEGLQVKHLVAGFDFTFGHKGAGNMNNINEFSKGNFSYTTVGKVLSNNDKISSTNIRHLLKNGKIEEVNELLGRTFSCDGKVVRGDQRGRTIGFPTANMQVDQDAILPKPGIYAVKVHHKNMIYEAIASLGTNPTFTPESSQLKLEVYILDFGQEIYGELLSLNWYHFIREEKKFTDVQELIDTMKQDENITRNFFLNDKKQ